MTDPHLPFVRAICARPDDDLPRLVYADWLDENAGVVPCPSCVAILQPTSGGLWPCRVCGAKEWSEHGTVPGPDAERAEFIRLQCEVATIPACRYGQPPWYCQCHVCKMLRRDQELRQANAVKWMQTDGIETIGRNNIRVEWHRGFVEELTCSWADCRAHLSAIRQRTPVRKVRLTTEPTRGDDHDSRLYWSQKVAQIFACSAYPGIEFELPPRQERSPWYDEQNQMRPSQYEGLLDRKSVV